MSLPVAGSAFERHIVRYTVERMNLTPVMLEASLRRTKPDRWEALMGTVAEAWIEQGRAEGIERGLAQGIEQGIEQGRAEVQAALSAHAQAGSARTSRRLRASRPQATPTRWTGPSWSAYWSA